MTRLRWTLLIAVAIVVADQLTKAWAQRALADGPIVLIDGFLRFRLTENPGAAFSSFQGAGPLLAIVAVGVAAWIVMMIRRSGHTLEAVALALVLGGAVGNLVDRLTRGEGLLDGPVVDFVDFSFFPTFNVADAAISIGAVLLLVAVMRQGDPSPDPVSPDAAAPDPAAPDPANSDPVSPDPGSSDRELSHGAASPDDATEVSDAERTPAPGDDNPTSGHVGG